MGLMGLQDVFFKLALPFDSDEARELSALLSQMSSAMEFFSRKTEPNFQRNFAITQSLKKSLLRKEQMPFAGT